MKKLILLVPLVFFIIPSVSFAGFTVNYDPDEDGMLIIPYFSFGHWEAWEAEGGYMEVWLQENYGEEPKFKLRLQASQKKFYFEVCGLWTFYPKFSNGTQAGSKQFYQFLIDRGCNDYDDQFEMYEGLDPNKKSDWEGASPINNDKNYKKPKPNSSGNNGGNDGNGDGSDNDNGNGDGSSGDDCSSRICECIGELKETGNKIGDAVNSNGDKLKDIVDNTSVLPSMDNSLKDILGQLVTNETVKSPSIPNKEPYDTSDVIENNKPSQPSEPFQDDNTYFSDGGHVDAPPPMPEPPAITDCWEHGGFWCREDDGEREKELDLDKELAMDTELNLDSEFQRDRELERNREMHRDRELEPDREMQRDYELGQDNFYSVDPVFDLITFERDSELRLDKFHRDPIFEMPIFDFTNTFGQTHWYNQTHWFE